MAEQTTLITDQDREVFNKADEHFRFLREGGVVAGSFTLVNEYVRVLNELTGLYGYVVTRHSAVKAAQENNEIRYYIQLKGKAEAAGEKFVSASAEREAKHAVADLIEAEMVLESYVEAINQAILTIKKVIDTQSSEFRREA